MAQQSAFSSSFIYRWTYDVFLSFRGEDTRYGFTGHLNNALHLRGIRTFMDDVAIRRGEEITPSLFKAIKESRIAIIVFSENYASSTFCLGELVRILECMTAERRLVWPVFYNVDPSQVRHQRGSYEEALAMHERKFQHDIQKVNNWRLALTTAANLSGFHFENGHEYEYEFIGRIIHEVSRRLSRIPLHVADYPVGLEARVHAIKTLLAIDSDPGVIMVGIYGMGGIGKSTLARAVYNSIADNFDGWCFLSDIREKSIKHGLVQLQETMLSELFGDKDIKLEYVHKGIQILKCRLQQKKILLILDDVDKLEQLNAIAGSADWFDSGSRIIITTRDKHLLDIHGVNQKYEVKKLSHGEAHELFMWNAFKTSKLDQGYEDISNRVVCCAYGLPLALEVIGSNLFGKNLYEWNSALAKYERNSDKKVHEVLKVSYDDLEEDEKEIFLDIACFFKGESLKLVKKMLFYSRDCQSDYAIQVLNAKSLIHIECGRLVMHDLIQDMGREIVKQESLVEPGGRSRLWYYEDILHVLEDNTGTDKIVVIMLKLPKEEEVHWNGKAFKKMKNLRVLLVENAQFSTSCKHLPNSLRVLDWKGYPSSVLPSGFYPRKLFILNLPDSSLTMLDPLKNLKHLIKMDLRCCKFLRKVPDLSEVPNLTWLYLDQCSNLIEIHDSIGFLDKLKVLSAKSCLNLKNLPRSIKWTSLEVLNVSHCSKIQSFPKVLEKMKYLEEVHLSETAIEELPRDLSEAPNLMELYLDQCTNLIEIHDSIGFLDKLRVLSAKSCLNLKNLPHAIKWTSLRELNFSHCSKIRSFPKVLEKMKYLEEVHLSETAIEELPRDLSEAPNLMELYLDQCPNLIQIHDSIGFLDKLRVLSTKSCLNLKNLPCAIKWTSLRELNVSHCPNLQSFPEVLEEMMHLKNLNLSGTAIEELPFSIQNLIGLSVLDVSKCTRLIQLPTSILMLPSLIEMRATSSREFDFFNKRDSPEQRQEEAASMVTHKWIALILDHCFFTSESLQKCLSSLFNVFQLVLRGCSFTTLPECLKECRSLSILRLDNCKQLQYIRGIPPSMKILSTRNCTALSSQCSSMLLSQTMHEAGKTNFIMPGTRIPKWFDHFGRGDTLSFWFCKQFPSIALLLVVDYCELGLTLDIDVVMNGTQSIHHSTSYITSTLETEHTIMFDLDEHTIPLTDFKSSLNLLPEWNQAQILCIPHQLTTMHKPKVKWVGVHVYRNSTSTEDFRFTNPYMLKRECCRFYSSDHDSNQNSYSGFKKQCR